MTEGLSSLNLSLFDAPKTDPFPPKATEPAQVPFTVHIKKTRSGRDILVCTVQPAPDSALKMAADQGLALFLPREIELMRGCPSDLVDKIIEIKTIFPGADVAKVITDHPEAAS